MTPRWVGKGPNPRRRAEAYQPPLVSAGWPDNEGGGPFPAHPFGADVIFASPLRRSSSPYLWIDTTRRRCLMRGENHGVAGSLGLQREPRTSFPLSPPTIKTPPRMILTMALCLPKKSVVTCCPVLPI